MKMKTLMILAGTLVLAAGSGFAQMGGGMGGGGTGHMGGGHNGGGMGYGMHGSGGMISGMMGNTTAYGYLDVLNPVGSPDEALAVIQPFIDLSNSGLHISELWEYKTAYKAELSDVKGERAFDLLVDKFTGAVGPEMGFSMMMNASYGRSLYRMPRLGRSLALTPDQAAASARSFIEKNGLSYTLGTPEVYPGYYKFHTQDGTDFGMDIMVNGYNGRIWMNTLLGVPLAKY